MAGLPGNRKGRGPEGQKITLSELEELSYFAYNLQARIFTKYVALFHPKPESILRVDQIFSPVIQPITEDNTLPDFEP